MSALITFSAFWLGLFAGGQHALHGPDHFAGVAPFAARSGRRAWRVGMAWGLGHASGAAFAACLALFFRAVIPGIEETVSSFSDRIVGILMCVVGALGLRSALRARWHDRAHGGSGVPHEHARPIALFRRAPRSAFVIGLFHGAGGLAHLFAVVPALAFPGTLLPALYLSGYALGSLALITAFAAGVGRVAPQSEPRLQRLALVGASAASLAVGVLWALRA